MTRLEWEKANKAERDRRHAQRALETGKRQVALRDWATKRELSCFKCGRPAEDVWIAKTGISKRGAWLICRDCVEEKRT